MVSETTYIRRHIILNTKSAYSLNQQKKTSSVCASPLRPKTHKLVVSHMEQFLELAVQSSCIHSGFSCLLICLFVKNQFLCYLQNVNKNKAYQGLALATEATQLSYQKQARSTNKTIACLLPKHGTIILKPEIQNFEKRILPLGYKKPFVMQRWEINSLY